MYSNNTTQQTNIHILLKYYVEPKYVCNLEKIFVRTYVVFFESLPILIKNVSS